LLVGHGHHITSTYPRMTLPRDHEKSKRSWKRISKRAKRPKRLPNFHRKHKFDERDIPTVIEIVDSALYPSIRDKAARLGCSCSTVHRFVNARRAGKPVINVGKRPQPRRTSQQLRHTRQLTAALKSLFEDHPDYTCPEFTSALAHKGLKTTRFAVYRILTEKLLKDYRVYKITPARADPAVRFARAKLIKARRRKKGRAV
jgi:hypothetical protein